MVNGINITQGRFSSCTILSIMNTQPRAMNGFHIIIRARLFISPDHFRTIRGHILIFRGRISHSILGINV